LEFGKEIIGENPGLTQNPVEGERRRGKGKHNFRMLPEHKEDGGLRRSFF